MYRHYAIFFFTILLVMSCGSPLKTRVDIGQPELDTAFYNKYIQKGPDTNMYPVFIRASSQRGPVSKFGLNTLFDGDETTWWSAAPGLNTGEWIEIDPRDIPAKSFKFFIANDPVMARINTAMVIVNDSLYGHFASGTMINLPEKCTSIKIKADEAGGLNEVKLELENDSTGGLWVTKKNLVIRYNSKSFGVSELEFFDEQGEKLPVQAPPVKLAGINCHGIDDHSEKFYVFDNNPLTAAQWSKGEHSNDMIFTFRDFVPFTKFRIFIGKTSFQEYGAIKEIGFRISGKDEQKYTLKEGMNEIVMTAPYVARTYTLSFYGFQSGDAGGINEFQGYDGARWYHIEPDSLYTRSDGVKDSLTNTPVHGLLNNQISYLYNYTVAKTDTYEITNNDISQSAVEKRVMKKSSLLIRTNGTWEAVISQQVIKYGKKVTLTNNEKQIFGDYKVNSQSEDQVVLGIRYSLQETRSIDGKPGSPSTKVMTGKAVINKTNFRIDGVMDMVISY